MPLNTDEEKEFVSAEIKNEMVDNYRDTVNHYEGEDHPYDDFFEHYMVDLVLRSNIFDDEEDEISSSDGPCQTTAGELTNEVLGMVIGGARDLKIDGWVRSSNKLVLIQAKYHEDPNYVEPRTGAIDELVYSKLLLESVPDCGNNKRRELGQWYLENRENLEIILVAGVWSKVLGFSNGNENDDASQIINEHEIIIYDYEAILNEYYQLSNPKSYTTPESKAITGKFLPTLEEDGVIKEMIGFAKLNDLATFFTGEENKRDLGLLEPNVRMKIADKSTRAAEIEAEIHNTLTETAEDFFALNNGIVMVCTGITTTEEDDRRYILQKPGIVNGGQSIQAIWEKRNEFSGDGSATVKIVAADNERTLKISEAANSQNEVTKRDLRSRRDEQIARKTNWFRNIPGEGDCKVYYEIRNGQWENETDEELDHSDYVQGSVARKLDNEKAAQIYWAFFGGMGYPKAKKKSMWSDNNLYNFLHNFETVVTNEQVTDYFFNPFNQLRQKTEVAYVHDVISGHYLLKMLRQITSQMGNARTIISNIQNNEDNVNEFDSKNKIFKGGTWTYTGLGVLNYIVKKHVDRSNLQTPDEQYARRREIIEHLIGGSITESITVRRCFQSTYPSYLNVDSNGHRVLILDVDTPHNIANQNLPNNFPNMARWLSSIEDLFRSSWSELQDESEEDLDVKTVLHGGCVEPFATKIRTKIDEIFNMQEHEILNRYPVSEEPVVEAPAPENIYNDLESTWNQLWDQMAPMPQKIRQANRIIPELDNIVEDIPEAAELRQSILDWLDNQN